MPDAYGILLPSYWDGSTGRALQARSKDAVILGTFLMANPFANMIGLYELSQKKIETYLPVLKNRRAVRRALDVLAVEKYIFYDFRADFVWVCNMARVRLQLQGTPMPRADKRRLGAVRLYESLPNNGLLSLFYDRYSHELMLPRRRGEEISTEGAYEGASEGAYEAPPPTSVSGSVRTEDQKSGVRAAALSVPVPTETGSAAPQTARRLHDPTPRTADENVEVITQLVLTDILPLAVPDAELADAVKDRCARLHIAYTGQVVRRAIESAQFRRHLQSGWDLPPEVKS